MTTNGGGCKEIFVTYNLKESGGLCDKKGKIISNEDTEIVFETPSETYRVLNDEHLEWKQRHGWFRIGKVQNIAIREIDHDYTKY